MIRVFTISFFILLSNIAKSQTWPSIGCPDVPYVKGVDGVIYHTCDCGDSIKVVHNNVVIVKKVVHKSQAKVRKKIIDVQKAETFCHNCDHYTSRMHIWAQQINGYVSKTEKDSNGYFKLTPLGEFVHTNFYNKNWNTSDIPKKLYKYFPKDYFTNEAYYVKLMWDNY